MPILPFRALLFSHRACWTSSHQPWHWQVQITYIPRYPIFNIWNISNISDISNIQHLYIYKPFLVQVDSSTFHQQPPSWWSLKVSLKRRNCTFCHQLPVETKLYHTTAEIVIRDTTFTFQKIPSNYMIGWNFNFKTSKLGRIGRTYSFLANLVGLAWPTVFSQSWSDGPDPHPSWVALLDFPLAHIQASPD